MANVPLSSGPVPSVEGLCLVKEGETVKLFYRNADGSLEAAPACEFVNSGGNGPDAVIYINRHTLASDSKFRKDTATGSVYVHI